MIKGITFCCVLILMIVMVVVTIDVKSKTIRMVTQCWETTNPTNVTSLCSCDYECQDGGGCSAKDTECTCQKTALGTGITCETSPTVMDPPVECYGVSSTNTAEVCSGHGECIDQNMCACSMAWDGEECDEFKPYTYIEPYLTGSLLWLLIIIALIILSISLLVTLRCILYLTAKNHIDDILEKREIKKKNMGLYKRIVASKVSLLEDMQTHISRSSDDINRILKMHLKRCSIDDLMQHIEPELVEKSGLSSQATPKERSIKDAEDKRHAEERLRNSLSIDGTEGGYQAVLEFIRNAYERQSFDEIQMVREITMELLAVHMKTKSEIVLNNVYLTDVFKLMDEVFLSFLSILRVHRSDFPVDVIDVEIQRIQLELKHLKTNSIPPIKMYKSKSFPSSEVHQRIDKEVRGSFNRTKDIYIESLQQDVEAMAQQIIDRVSENKDWEVVYLCEKLHTVVTDAMLDVDTPLILLKVLGPVIQTIIDRDENNYKVSLGCVRVLVDIGCLCVLRQRISGIGMNSSDKEQLLESLDDFETKFFLHPEKFDPTGQLQFYVNMLKQSLYMMDDTDDFWELVLEKIDLTAPGEVIGLVKRTIQRVPNRWYIKCLLMWIHGHTLFQFDSHYRYGKELLSKSFLRYRVSKLEILPFVHHHQNFILIELIASHLMASIHDAEYSASPLYGKVFKKLLSYAKVRKISSKNIDLITHALMSIRQLFNQSEKVRVQFFDDFKIRKVLLGLRKQKKSGPIRELIHHILEPPSEYAAIDEMMRQVIPCLEFLSLDINLSGPQVSKFFFPDIEQMRSMDEVYDLFAQESLQLVIKASGGQGKSCILRHLAFYMYDQLDIYPLFIRADVLATFAKQWTDGDIEANIQLLIDALFESHDDAFSTILSESSRIQLRIELIRVMKLKPLALIIDGFDEIPGLTRSVFMKLFNKISGLTAESGYHGELHFRHLLFSSRPEALSGFDLPKVVQYAELQLLTPEDANELVRSVLLSVLNIKSLVDSNYGSDIYRRYAKTPLNVTNPLLAILLIRRLLDSEEQDDYQITNRYLLYEHLMRAAIDQAKTTRKHPEHSVAHASRYWIMTTYSIIAYILHRLPNATRFDVIQLINQSEIYPHIISREVWLTNIKNPAQNIIETLVAFSTLANQQQNQIVFSHRSIQEFFVARFLSNTSEQCMTLRRVFNAQNRTRFSYLEDSVMHHDWWREVFKFVIACYLPSVTMLKKNDEQEDEEQDDETTEIAMLKNNPFTSVSDMINSESRVSTISIVKQLFKYYFHVPQEHTPHYDLIYKVIPQAIIQDFNDTRLKSGLNKLFTFMMEGCHFTIDMFYAHLTNIGIPLKTSKPSLFKFMNYYHVPMKYKNYSGVYATAISFPYFVVGDDHKFECFHMGKGHSIFKGSYGKPNDTTFYKFSICEQTIVALVEQNLMVCDISTLEKLEMDAVAPFKKVVDADISEAYFGDDGSIVYEQDDQSFFYMPSVLEPTKIINIGKLKGYANFCTCSKNSISLVVQDDIPNPKKEDHESDSSVDSTMTSDTCLYYTLESDGYTLKKEVIFECQDPDMVSDFYRFDENRYLVFLSEHMIVLEAKETEISSNLSDIEEKSKKVEPFSDDDDLMLPVFPSTKSIRKVINRFPIKSGSKYKLFPEHNMVAITYSTSTLFVTLNGQIVRMYDIPCTPFTFDDYLYFDNTTKQIDYIHAVDRFNVELFPLPNTKPANKKKILSSFIQLDEYNVVPLSHFFMLSTQLDSKLHSNIRCLMYLEEDKRVLYEKDNDICVFNLTTLVETTVIADAAYKQHVIYLNRFLYVSSVDGKLFAYDLESLKLIDTLTFLESNQEDPEDICFTVIEKYLYLSYYESSKFFVYRIGANGSLKKQTEKKIRNAKEDCDKLHTLVASKFILAEFIDALQFYDLSGNLQKTIPIDEDMDRIKLVQHQKTQYIMCLMHEGLRLYSANGDLLQKFSFAFTQEEVCTVDDVVVFHHNVTSCDDFDKLESYGVKDYSLLDINKFFFLVAVEDYLAFYDSRCPDPLFYLKLDDGINSMSSVTYQGKHQILFCFKSKNIMMEESILVDLFTGSVTNLALSVNQVDKSIEKNVAKSQTELLNELVQLQTRLLEVYATKPNKNS